MRIRVATFNLNNLFSRYNFQAELGDLTAGESGGYSVIFGEDEVKIRQFMGRLVKAKDANETETIARRIRTMDADVLAVQEVEHIGILKEFNRDYLGGMYKEVALIDGNDQRLIDVGILSKYPLGAITTHQAAKHPDDSSRRVFGRDLLQVEILDHRGKEMFTVFNTHMKSHFVPFGDDPISGAIAANARRRRQAEVTERIIREHMRKNSRFVLLGDMNDPPDSTDLAPMLTHKGGAMINALADARETRPAKPETVGQGAGPSDPVWTHRFNPSGPTPPHYSLFDQIWLSPKFSGAFENAMIDRRTKHGGDGSDHDPAWVDLILD